MKPRVLDPSKEMLTKAKKKNSSVIWREGSAEDIELKSASVDGVLMSLTIHHWEDIHKGFEEVSRVLKRNGRLVLFTTLPGQTRAYWLYHYFPTMIEESVKILPSMNEIESDFANAGIEIIKREPYFVKPDLEDWFLYCGKHNPEVYFREEIRRGISSFSLLSHQREVPNGLAQLRKDIDTGEIEAIKKAYDNELGDYLFVVGRKS